MPKTIRFDCPHCGFAMSAESRQAGRKGSCPRCGEDFQVPGADKPCEDGDAEEPVSWSQITAAREPTESPANSQLYCKIAGAVTGPFEPAALKRMAENGELMPTDRVRRGSDGKWILAERVKGLCFPKLAADSELPVAEMVSTEATGEEPVEHFPNESDRPDTFEMQPLEPVEEQPLITSQPPTPGLDSGKSSKHSLPSLSPRPGERILFQGSRFLVTPRRFVYGDDVFSVATICSVHYRTGPPDNTPWILLAVSGVLLTLAGLILIALNQAQAPVGLALITVGVILAGVGRYEILHAQQRHIVIVKSGVDVLKHTTTDRELIVELVDALNRAIILNNQS